MKLKISSFILALCFVQTVGFSQNDQLAIGAKAPLSDVKMEGAVTAPASLEDLKGKNGTLVVFSCNTCPFVVGMKDGGFSGWERNYNRIAAFAKEKGITMVLVNSNEAKRGDEDSKEEMRKRATEKQYSMPYVIDVDSKLANAFGAKTTPHVYLFDAEMQLVYKGAIDNSWDPVRKENLSYLENAINEMENGVKITESEPRGCSIKRVQKNK